MMEGILRRVDTQLIVPVLILIGIGLTTIFSINLLLFRNQLIFFILAIGIFFFFANADILILRNLSKPFYVLSCLGFLLLLVVGIETRGAARWLSIFGFQLQFSEMFKPFLAISLASFLTSSEKKLTTIGFLALLILPIIFLIYRQPDLGSSLIYLFTVISTLMLLGYPLWWFVSSGFIILTLFPFILRFLHGYQRERVLTFLHLSNDPLGTSYNAIQAIIAVGSGMILGKGLGQGTQSSLRFLPERHTDFIFATLSEDLGFVGSILVIVAVGFLLYRLYQIIKFTQNPFEKVFVITTFSLIFVQCVVNIGMNIGLLPIVGVPLPLVSYGGSSLLSTAIFLGLASGISSASKGNSALEIR